MSMKKTMYRIEKGLGLVFVVAALFSNDHWSTLLIMGWLMSNSADLTYIKNKLNK